MADKYEDLIPSDSGKVGYFPRPFIQCTLPHRDAGAVVAFARSAGKFRLILQPLIDKKKGKVINYGLPYGTIPRLILAWLSTEVVKTKSREIPLGESLSAFMRQLDMVPTGGRWGSITRLREQVKRLFTCSFSVVYDNHKRFATAGFKLASKAQFFWDTIKPDQSSLFGSTITLSDEFYQELIAHPVPLDMRILKELRTSPLALDLYNWLTYRVSYLHGETVIPWSALQEQFGADYKEPRMFRFNLIKQLERVISLYPARLSITDGGLKILPSSPSVPRKSRK